MCDSRVLGRRIHYKCFWALFHSYFCDSALKCAVPRLERWKWNFCSIVFLLYTLAGANDRSENRTPCLQASFSEHLLLPPSRYGSFSLESVWCSPVSWQINSYEFCCLSAVPKKIWRLCIFKDNLFFLACSLGLQNGSPLIEWFLWFMCMPYPFFFFSNVRESLFLGYYLMIPSTTQLLHNLTLSNITYFLPQAIVSSVSSLQFTDFFFCRFCKFLLVAEFGFTQKPCCTLSPASPCAERIKRPGMFHPSVSSALHLMFSWANICKMNPYFYGSTSHIHWFLQWHGQ